MMKSCLLVPFLAMTFLFYSCKVSKIQNDPQNVPNLDSDEYQEAFDRPEEHRIVGEVIQVNPSGIETQYSIQIVDNSGDTVMILARSEIIDKETNFSELEGKIATISYTESAEHIVYDMRIANDEFLESLHEVSDKNEPGFAETYSIIGRYVYAEPRATGMYLEIEGRYGTIYELSTQVTRSEWSDLEVECAIRVIVRRSAYEINLKE